MEASAATDAASGEDEARAHQLNAVGRELANRGDHAGAVDAYERALELRERHLGPTHPEVAAVLTNLGMAYKELAYLEDAEAMCLRALTIWESAYGPSDLLVAVARNNFAGVLVEEGNYEDALAHLQAALAVKQATLPAHHPMVAKAQNNLADAFFRLGCLDEAEARYKEALTTQLATLGEDHQDVKTTRNNLAAVYEALGLYAQAEDFLRSGSGNTPGESSAGAVDGLRLNNLAHAAHMQGRHAEAEGLYLRSIAIIKQVYGTDHPEYATSISNLASLYMEMHRTDEAGELLEAALRTLELSLPSDDQHPTTAQVLNNLAAFNFLQGERAVAHQLFARCLEIQQGALGSDNFHLAGTLSNVGACCLDEGDLDGAKEYFDAALSLQVSAYGEAHPRSRVTAGWLACRAERLRGEQQATTDRDAPEGLHYPLMAEGRSPERANPAPPPAPDTKPVQQLSTEDWETYEQMCSKR